MPDVGWRSAAALRLLILVLCSPAMLSKITMNQVWRDSKNEPIQCHGGSFIRWDGRWWWYGEGGKNKFGISPGVNAYSSFSLEGPWRYEGMVLNREFFAPLVGPIDAGSQIVVERPKVVHSNGQFVMWLHLDVSENTAVDAWANYVFRRAGVAVSSTPQGPFKPIRALRPNGLESLDLNLFHDNGDAYLIRACTKNQYMGISKLTSDLTNIAGNIVSVLKAKVEAPVMFRDPEDKSLFVLASAVHGWEPGRMFAFRAKGRNPKVEGAVWEPLEANPTLHPRSFFSQPTALLTLLDQDRNNAPYLVYVGDNWVFGPPHGLTEGFGVEMDMPPPGRFTAKYKAYIGKLLTWEHTRLPYASYVMLPVFFEMGEPVEGGSEKVRQPRIEFLPEWEPGRPFDVKQLKSFGCASGVHKVQPDGRISCCARACGRCGNPTPHPVVSTGTPILSDGSASISSSSSINSGGASASGSGSVGSGLGGGGGRSGRGGMGGGRGGGGRRSGGGGRSSGWRDRRQRRLLGDEDEDGCNDSSSSSSSSSSCGRRDHAVSGNASSKVSTRGEPAVDQNMHMRSSSRSWGRGTSSSTSLGSSRRKHASSSIGTKSSNETLAINDREGYSRVDDKSRGNEDAVLGDAHWEIAVAKLLAIAEEEAMAAEDAAGMRPFFHAGPQQFGNNADIERTAKEALRRNTSSTQRSTGQMQQSWQLWARHQQEQQWRHEVKEEEQMSENRRQQRRLLGEDESDEKREEKEQLECDDVKIAERARVCKEVDASGCVLPQLSWPQILKGEQAPLSVTGQGVGHGNYKWKNIGATMWKAKQAGKSAQFWKKNEGSSSEQAAR